MQPNLEKNTLKFPSQTVYETVVRQSSSDIIKDAKQWCTLKAIETRRPATPQDKQRHLFGGNRAKHGYRPPSAVTVEPPMFEFTELPAHITVGALGKSRLPPLSHKPTIPGNRVKQLQSKGGSSLKPRYQGNSEFVSESHAGTTNSSLETAQYTDVMSKPIRHLQSVGSHDTYKLQPSPPSNKPAKQNISSTAADNRTLDGERSSSVSYELLRESSASSSSSNDSRGSCEKNRKKALTSKIDSPADDDSTVDDALSSGDFIWDQNIRPLIDKMENRELDDPEGLCRLCRTLHDVLDSESYFGYISSKQRTSLLTVLFKLLKFNSADLILSCARIILKVGVRNRNLSSISKLIFRICRAQSHDQLFLEYHLIPVMFSVMGDTSDPISKQETYEAFIYLTGSLKFLSDSKNTASVMYSQGAVNAFVSFAYAVINVSKQHESSEDGKRVYKYAKDLVAQVATSLRNVLEVDKKAYQMSQIVLDLFSIWNYFVEDENITWIFSRIFSKLTMYPACYPGLLANPDWPGTFITALKRHAAAAEVVLRLCFALGNLSAHSDDLRKQLHFYHGSSVAGTGGDGDVGCLKTMTELLVVYSDQETPGNRGTPPVTGQRSPAGAESESAGSDKSNDVLIKVVRVIANMSVGEMVGPHIACDVDCVKQLLKMLESPSTLVNEELTVNILTTLNNLSYYDDAINSMHPSKESAISSNRMFLANSLLRLLMSGELRFMSELTAVLGNLTRYQDVQQLACQCKADLIMITLLDSGQEEVVYSACGVLINLSSNPDNRPTLLREQTISKLCDILRDFAPKNWRICGAACQLLWNLTRGSFLSSTHEDDLKSFVRMLQQLLDEDALKEIAQTNSLTSSARNDFYSSWKEDFYEVGRHLLASLVGEPSNLIPLDDEEADNSDESTRGKK